MVFQIRSHNNGSQHLGNVLLPITSPSKANILKGWPFSICDSIPTSISDSVSDIHRHITLQYMLKVFSN